MVSEADLLERLCRSLAFHVVESEITLQFSEGDCSLWRDEVKKARALIKEAGFDIDKLYPISERPTAERPQ